MATTTGLQYRAFVPATDTLLPVGNGDETVRATDYIYDSERTDATVEAVLERLAEREETPEYLDVAAASDRDAAEREAVLTVRESLRVGENPPGIFDDDGNLDFSAGVLITVAETGRRGLHVGEEALEALEE